MVQRLLRRHQRVVERPVAALCPRGQRRPRRQGRVRPQDGELLVDQAQVAILRQQRVENRFHAPTVAAAVIEELDQRERAFGVAGDRGFRVGEQRVAVFADGGPCLRGLLLGALRPQRLLGFEKDFRMFDQILTDDPPDGLDRQAVGCRAGLARGTVEIAQGVRLRRGDGEGRDS